MCRDHTDGPEVALLVVEGAAVACSNLESAGLEGQRIVLGVGERTHRAV